MESGRIVNRQLEKAQVSKVSLLWEVTRCCKHQAVTGSSPPTPMSSCVLSRLPFPVSFFPSFFFFFFFKVCCQKCLPLLLFWWHHPCPNLPLVSGSQFAFISLSGLWAASTYSKSPTHEPSSFKLSKMRAGFHQRQMGVTLQLALHLLLLTTLQLCHLPPPLPPPGSVSSCLFTRCQPLYASCSIVQQGTVLWNSKYSLYFVCLFF